MLIHFVGLVLCTTHILQSQYPTELNEWLDSTGWKYKCVLAKSQTSTCIICVLNVDRFVQWYGSSTKFSWVWRGSFGRCRPLLAHTLLCVGPLQPMSALWPFCLRSLYVLIGCEWSVDSRGWCFVDHACMNELLTWISQEMNGTWFYFPYDTQGLIMASYKIIALFVCILSSTFLLFVPVFCVWWC